jgi:sugar phosphate isomerase/epimerase
MPIAHELVLFAGCLPAASFRELVDAAASAGFDAVTVSPAIHKRTETTEALDGPGMKRVLDERGISVTAVEACGDWLPDTDEDGRAGPIRSSWRRDQFFEAAGELGAGKVIAAHLGRGAIEWTAAADSFGQLCRDAEDHGLRVALEFMPFSGVSDADLAWQLISDAECDNVGLVVDLAHLYRSGGISTLAAVPLDRIEILKLADGSEGTPDDLVDEVNAHRLLPGAGGFGIADVLERLDAAGVQASVGPALHRPDWSDLDPATIAGDLMRATLDVLPVA